jgi:DNA-binding NtrC family response regulator
MSTDTSGHKIVWVDDHEVTARLCCDVLEIVGFRAVPISISDINVVSQHAPFDLLITGNIQEPTRGVDLAQQAKQRWPSVPVVMVTGSGIVGLNPKAPPPGVDVLIPKEGVFPQVLDEIRRILRTHGGRVAAV